jgi:hypothetical protein
MVDLTIFNEDNSKKLTFAHKIVAQKIPAL